MTLTNNTIANNTPLIYDTGFCFDENNEVFRPGLEEKKITSEQINLPCNKDANEINCFGDFSSNHNCCPVINYCGGCDI